MGKYWFSDGKMNFFFADFLFLGLFMTKKHVLSDKFFSVCHAPLPLLDEIWDARISAVLSATAYKFRLSLVIWAGLMHLILRILKFWNFFKKLRSQKIINRPSSVWVRTKALKLHIILQTRSFHKTAFSDFRNFKIRLRKSNKKRNMRF